MSYRGSLTACLDHMATLFKQNRFTYLAITHCKAGKYYTLLTPEELDHRLDLPAGERDRLVIFTSLNELTILKSTTQQDMFN